MSISCLLFDEAGVGLVPTLLLRCAYWITCVVVQLHNISPVWGIYRSELSSSTGVSHHGADTCDKTQYYHLAFSFLRRFESLVDQSSCLHLVIAEIDRNGWSKRVWNADCRVLGRLLLSLFKVNLHFEGDLMVWSKTVEIKSNNRIITTFFRLWGGGQNSSDNCKHETMSTLTHNYITAAIKLNYLSIKIILNDQLTVLLTCKLLLFIE